MQSKNKMRSTIPFLVFYLVLPFSQGVVAGFSITEHTLEKVENASKTTVKGVKDLVEGSVSAPVSVMRGDSAKGEIEKTVIGFWDATTGAIGTALYTGVTIVAVVVEGSGTVVQGAGEVLGGLLDFEGATDDFTDFVCDVLNKELREDCKVTDGVVEKVDNDKLIVTDLVPSPLLEYFF